MCAQKACGLAIRRISEKDDATFIERRLGLIFIHTHPVVMCSLITEAWPILFFPGFSVWRMKKLNMNFPIKLITRCDLVM